MPPILALPRLRGMVQGGSLEGLFIMNQAHGVARKAPQTLSQPSSTIPRRAKEKGSNLNPDFMGDLAGKKSMHLQREDCFCK